MYTQQFDPVSDSLGLSSIFAVLPVLALFILLGGLKMAAQWAALIALGVAMLVAMIVYGMPVDQTALSASQGAVFGLFPIMWIVVTAIWIYNMTVETGYFAVLRRSFGAVSNDQRVQAVIIAFCFGALLEALAGFGTPVAITAVMLIALGFKPIKAASVALVANTAPVAFGAIAIPIVTLAEITGLPKEDLGAMVGRQTPFLALVVPLILIGMVDGARGIRQAWPVAVVGGLVFALAQYLTSNFISVELTDIVSALASTRHWCCCCACGSPRSRCSARMRRRARAAPRPAVAGAEGHDPVLEAEVSRRDDTKKDPPADVLPGLLALPDHHRRLLDRPDPGGQGRARRVALDHHVPVAGPRRPEPGRRAAQLADLQLQLAAGGRHPAADLRLLDHGGSSGFAVKVDQGVRWLAGPAQVGDPDRGGRPGAGLRHEPVRPDHHARPRGRREPGDFFAFLSPLIGWLGVAVTGSDTSSNALFGALQVTAANDAGMSPTLLAAANSSGGVLGKMVSPQNLAIGAAAVGLAGQEGDLFRKVLGWSIALVLIMCVLVYLQSTPVLEWMVVK